MRPSTITPRRRRTVVPFVAILALILCQGEAFQTRQQPRPPLLSSNPSHPSTQLFSARPPSHPRKSNTVAFHRRKSNTAAFYSTSADPLLADKKEVKSFADRMRNLVVKQDREERVLLTTADSTNGSSRGSKINPRKPPSVHEVVSLQQYKQVVADEPDKLVVVRFYASWCRACLAVEPLFYRMANSMPDVKFVEVPVLEENANLHQGLGVPALPFGHIYHPKTGLVEELRIAKKEFKNFQAVVEMYRSAECNDLEIDPDSGMFVSPFSHHSSQVESN